MCFVNDKEKLEDAFRLFRCISKPILFENARVSSCISTISLQFKISSFYVSPSLVLFASVPFRSRLFTRDEAEMRGYTEEGEKERIRSYYVGIE